MVSLEFWFEFASTYSYDANALLLRAGEAATKALLRGRTEEATRRGVFGVPSFFVGAELFLGSDRLDMAIAAAHARD